MLCPSLCPYLLGVLLLFVAAPGCQVMERSRPLAVLVRDAESQQPIPMARVWASYGVNLPPWAPHDNSAMTGADGIAGMPIVPWDDNSLQVNARAEGYLPMSANLSNKTVSQIKPATWFGHVESCPPSLVVEMYAQPGFSVELIVSTGYRGLVRAEVQFEDNSSFPPGQRCFTYPVSSAGAALVRGPTLLKRYPPDYRAKYADGTVLSNGGDAESVGFHWLKHDGHDEVFIVGTQWDFDRLRREMFPGEAFMAIGSADSPTGGGRQGRHGRGNQADAD